MFEAALREYRERLPYNPASSSPPQLAEHYQHCLKLSAENKVSQKNAFNLQLIDWMAQAIGKKAKKTDGEVDINDFQVSRCPRWDPLTYLS